MRTDGAAQISVFSLNCDAAFAEDVNCLLRWLDLQGQICAHRRCHDNFDIYCGGSESTRLSPNREFPGRNKLEEVFAVRICRSVLLEALFHASQADVSVFNH